MRYAIEDETGRGDGGIDFLGKGSGDVNNNSELFTVPADGPGILDRTPGSQKGSAFDRVQPNPTATKLLQIYVGEITSRNDQSSKNDTMT